MAMETVINPAALAALIEKDGITQLQLAEAADISPQMMSAVLLGHRQMSAEKRKRVANALRVPLSAIETLREVPDAAARGVPA